MTSFPVPGMVQYEKQSSMVRLANLKFEKNPNLPQKLLCVLLEAKDTLEDSKRCLELEPESSPMAKYSKIISEDLGELDDYIVMVRDLSGQ